MIFDSPSVIKLKSLRQKITQVASAIILIAWGFGTYLFLPKQTETISIKESTGDKKDILPRVVCSLESEALSIDAFRADFHLPNLVDEISLLGIASRPDFLSGEEKMMLYLKGSKQGVIVSAGEKLFLCYIDGQLRFSDYATPLWLKAVPEYGGAKISISLWLPIEGKERVVTDGIDFHLNLATQKSGKTTVNELDGIPAEVLKPLSSMQWWGKDELFSTYGGPEYQDRAGKERLVVGDGKTILFVQKGDYLLWNGCRWVVADNNSSRHDQYIARVRSIGPNRLELDVWGKEGIYRQPIGFSKTTGKIGNFKMDQVMTRIRQRTSSRVSCKLGQKNTILRNGDWVVHHDGTWHVLRTLDEIDKYLEHKTKGDLFVLDCIEKEEGKSLLKGHLFNDSRSHVEVVTLPLTQSEKQKETPTKRFQRRKYPIDDFDDDFDDEDDDFNDENDEYLHLMNARRRHAMPDDY